MCLPLELSQKLFGIQHLTNYQRTPTLNSKVEASLLTKVFRGVPQFLQANAGAVTHTGLQPSPSTCSLTQWSLIVLSFDILLS